MKHQIILLSMILVLAGCNKPQVKDSLIEHTFIDQTVTATVLSRGPEAKELADCVQSLLENDISTINFISEDEFRDALFPWFESSTAPKSLEELNSTMNIPFVLDRIKSLNIRFVISVGGYKSEGSWTGSLHGGGMGPGVAVFGYTSSDRRAEISAFVWDLKEMATSEDIHVEKWGSFQVIGFILPIPIPDTTKADACSETTKKIFNFIRDKISHKNN